MCFITEYASLICGTVRKREEAQRKQLRCSCVCFRPELFVRRQDKQQTLGDRDLPTQTLASCTARDQKAQQPFAKQGVLLTEIVYNLVFCRLAQQYNLSFIYTRYSSNINCG